MGVFVANAHNEEGIINPSADELLEKAESKYGLVIFGARRARQINAYYSQMHENLFDHVGPLVDSEPNEKSLSVAMREINEGLIEARHVSEGTFDENGDLIPEEAPSAFLTGGFYTEEYSEAAPIVEYVDAEDSE
ncbi:DNA-directed RNA polymerase subunit omega [Rothia sp. CCM 9418]|uniref:DNA-directed RNA polymerase subunit omega n=1 Tax=unclassified Rothia (in: high G+C Gram-positive bacteria) TaxID=2689056 RepID=UPI003ACA3A62